MARGFLGTPPVQVQVLSHRGHPRCSFSDAPARPPKDCGRAVGRREAGEPARSMLWLALLSVCGHVFNGAQGTGARQGAGSCGNLQGQGCTDPGQRAGSRRTLQDLAAGLADPGWR
ncbi:unnamed protein product [Prorocentrum cordatum]|uniref:Uncharacterized protein n=1 Tax=Prorocentrum cordatum TaxID=2364126 RepID=A0ABN9XZ59_9DINO|nr:unnamed protein product [Polarella glacialis]